MLDWRVQQFEYWNAYRQPQSVHRYGAPESTNLLLTNQHLATMADVEYCMMVDTKQLEREWEQFVLILKRLKKAGLKWYWWNNDHPKFRGTVEYWSELRHWQQEVSQIAMDVWGWCTDSMAAYMMGELFLVHEQHLPNEEIWFVHADMIMHDSKLAGIQMNYNASYTNGSDGFKFRCKYGFNVAIMNKSDIMLTEWRLFLCHIAQLRMVLFDMDSTACWNLPYFVYYWMQWIQIFEDIGRVVKDYQPFKK